ncbi:SUMO-specific isopeptidase USPL1 [Kryptolebias marmoratus]|uniref:SUMO-specific isopeptidase USPL1 n=1 Tax=Kryptolebias marmoratus TaxID=37003 RepID=UPI0007F89F9E|nr:SUMO-specific isopeptidase USPL1 [Kryptolebias marmoratus]XP_024862096.1 SUMO-specific isopeptidase USPL1 [Kryptolebias marmoratus]
MVLFFEWHRTAVDPKTSSSCLSMTGEDTGLEALASPQAGYLGKVQERAESLEHCPWCTSKGLTYALRSYHINLQESITLCTNPQCLFPLVTRPLEDVLSSLAPTVPVVGNKRKNSLELEKDTIESPVKRLRSSEVASLLSQQQVDDGSENPHTNGLRAVPETPSETVNGNHKGCVETETDGWDPLQDEDVAPPSCSAPFGHSSDVLVNSAAAEPSLCPHLGVNGASENGFKEKNAPVLNGCSSRDFSSTGIEFPMTLCDEQTTPREEKSLNADTAGSGDAEGVSSESEGLSFLSSRQSEELVFVPKWLLWRNSDNLCWLDSLLAALVNCRTLRRCKPKDEPRHSSVWQLMRGYEDVCAAVQMHQQTGGDGVVRVPRPVLQKADADLQRLRMSIFELLQPKLHCILGQRETPVFAMPLLLTADSWAEHLFQSSFRWEFKCSECEVVTKERVVKTLPTFTNIVPDWRPLNAVHLSVCNVCGKKNQKRTMSLESVPPVFALHFVEGLPDGDVGTFTFSFQGRRYSVTTVIQFNHRLRHFVTWIRNDESWLEYDDLQHPDFKTHGKLQVPAHEMHVVFWEVEDDADPPAGSPLNTLAEQPAAEKAKTPSLNHLRVDEPLDQSLLTLHNDTDIVDALTEKDSSLMDTTVTAGVDTSIGSTTLLDAFEGLSHNDIITLTLVEVDSSASGMQLLNGHQRTEDARTEGPAPSPDSSLPAAGGDMCHGADAEPPATLGSSNPESVDSSSTDATSAPAARSGRGRGTSQTKTISKRRGEEAAASEAAPQTSPAASFELPAAVGQEAVGSAAQDNSPPAEVARQASPESVTDTSPLSTSQKSPPLDQNARWSFLLSKHPLSHLHKPVSKPPSRTEARSSQPVHSTPNPVKRQMVPPGLPKPQIITDSLKLPPKAAEMYCGFGTKSSTSPLPSPPLPNGNTKPFQTLTANPPAPPAVTSLKTHRSSKVPPGLSETEALRYKLIKKLKAKKKKLAKLNQLLGHQERLQPDSTDLNSPSTVASSTYDGSGGDGDDFLSDLLSPATTASNLSPDSTGFLEMLSNGRDGADNMDGAMKGGGAASQTGCGTSVPETENFLEDFLTQWL